VHVVWVDVTPGNNEIYYRRSNDNGGLWGKQKRLTKNIGESWQPSIGVSGSSVHVVWRDDTPGNDEIFHKRSTDNGVSWSKQKRLTNNAGYSTDPSIAVSGSNVHVVWSDLTPGNWEIFYMRSTDNGATWRKTKRLTKNSGVSTRPTIAVSGRNVHVVWEDSNPGNPELLYKRSTDNGATWSKQKRLTRTAGYSYRPDISVSGRDIHVVWKDNTSGNYEIYYKRSTDNGNTWSKQKRLTKNAGESTDPAIAASGKDIHVVWFDDTLGNNEIFYKRSSDNGATWRKQKRITKNAEDSRTPEAAAAGGTVHIAWADFAPGNFEIFYKRGP
jgi:Neuraminidase (sialidase)